MSEIEELQRRINAALDRIGQGIEARAESGADPAQLAELKQALEEEKLANEQLRERLKTMHARREQLEEELEAAREQSAEYPGKFDAELQGLRKANDQLRENNKALREANEAGVGEPHLINKAMLAELESLRASRAADRAETSAILSELTAVIDNSSDSKEEEDA